jgi:cytidine deaminase
VCSFRSVVSKSGRAYPGVNVENSAYPLSRCAEQVAVGAMVTGGEREIEMVLILSKSSPPATPCGACRQVISEFASPDTPIICSNDRGEELRFTIGELLPAAFKLDE